MSYDANIPNAGQSPGVFPPQNASNFTRLKTIIAGDHVFNDTLAANDGIHKQSTYVNRTDPSSLPAGANGIQYTKNNAQGRGQEFYYDGTVYLPVSPIKAFVNFQGNTSGTDPLNMTIRSSYNVTSVERTDTGRYKITFTNPFVPNGQGDKYITLPSAMDSGVTAMANVRSNSSLGSVQTDTFCLIETVRRNDGDRINPRYVGVIFISVV